MKRILVGAALAAISAVMALGAKAQMLPPTPTPSPTPTVSLILDMDVRMAQGDVMRLAEAMPPEKYDFAPTQGEFKGVRTFSQQISHIAATNYMVASAALGEENPFPPGADENGPPSIKGKTAVVKFLSDSFAYAHKAAATLTEANATEMMPSPFGGGKMPRLAILTTVTWHTFDHYGQMVVYARMNGIVPPASQPAAVTSPRQ